MLGWIITELNLIGARSSVPAARIRRSFPAYTFNI